MRKQPFSYLYNSKELFVQNIIFFHLTTSIRENPLIFFKKTTEKLTMLVIKTNIMSFSHF
ncbi:hypothetical protein HMPREF0346_1663 [Enterococcus faecalis EnGen0297]|nr:hypothetical protein HMPREF0346_1663 [Enterococcus faecalis EnGen0297]